MVTHKVQSIRRHSIPDSNRVLTTLSPLTKIDVYCGRQLVMFDNYHPVPSCPITDHAGCSIKWTGHGPVLDTPILYRLI